MRGETTAILQPPQSYPTPKVNQNQVNAGAVSRFEQSGSAKNTVSEDKHGTFQTEAHEHPAVVKYAAVQVIREAEEREASAGGARS